MMRMCMVSTVNTDLLRTQLDQLHSEADSTRKKANNARFRLIRLSEAAENLRRQAAKNLRMGQENDAREILVQKKKVMLALEKSKDRVELLDELAAKLNEAISIKEAQLVENVASDPEINGDDARGPVRIVSPTPGSEKNLPEKININPNFSDVEDRDLNPDEDPGVAAITTNDFSGMSSYVEFLHDVNQQLHKIEEDLGVISKLPISVPNNEEKVTNSKMRQISEILENVRGTRARIQNFVDQIEATGPPNVKTESTVVNSLLLRNTD